MIQKKSFTMALKRALQSGTFNYIGQQAKEFPNELCHIEDLKVDDQSWWECNPITKIDLSNNQISQIPEDISVLADLQLIRMKNNTLITFPKTLISLQNIKSLDFSHNRLKFVPQELSYGLSLVELNLSENNLQFIPTLEKLKNLEFVFLDRNKLTELPNFGANVKKIEAYQNQIKVLRRGTLQQCCLLEHLNLNKNQIEFIQENSFNNANNLISLEMKENRLNEFNQVPKSPKLDTIALSFNRLTCYTEFKKSPNLTVLILNDNKLKSLSNDIFSLNKLKTLDISNNDLSDLPCQLGFITSLVRIQLEGNPLKSIRQNIKTGGTNVIKKYLQDKMDPTLKAKVQSKTATSFEKVSEGEYWRKLIHEFNQNGELILRKMNLTEIDPLVYEQNLRGLNLTQNKIKTLSEDIGRLQSLKYLIVNNNDLQELPSNVGRIEALELIEAKNNHLSTFGELKAGKRQFPNLNYLDLSANRIKILPKAILDLPKLRTLHLSYNSLCDIEALWNPSQLLRLEILDVSNNQIGDVSDNVFSKSSLNYLNLENNSLTKLPTVLGFMKLSGLKVDGNPIKLIKRSVIQKGTVTILDFLRTKHTGSIPEQPQREQMLPPPQQQPQSYYQETVNANRPSVTSQQKQHYYDEEPQDKPRIDPAIVKKRVSEIEAEIAALQRQVEMNMSMNNIQKMDRKKRIQALMVEKNKLLK